MAYRSPAAWLTDACGGVLVVIGAAVLLRGPSAAPLFGILRVGGPSIRPATAACLMVLGVMLLVVRRLNDGTFTGAARAALSALALGTGALAAWRLLRLWQRVGEDTRPVSPHTVASLVLLGVAVLVAVRAGKRRRQTANVLALAGSLAPWLAVLGYMTGTPMFFAVPGDPQTGMSLVSAVGLMVAGVGVMGLFPDHGFVALMTERSSGGTMMRALLPAALLFPVGAGALLAAAERAGWFPRDVALAINLGVTSVILTGLVLLIGLQLKRREAERRAAALEREQLLARLQQSLDELRALQTNLVTVCAWTQRVLDEGKWVRFEEFLDKRLHISVSHGISAEAAAEELQSLEDWMAQPAKPSSSDATHGIAASSSTDITSGPDDGTPRG